MIWDAFLSDSQIKESIRSCQPSDYLDIVSNGDRDGNMTSVSVIHRNGSTNDITVTYTYLVDTVGFHTFQEEFRRSYEAALRNPDRARCNTRSCQKET